MSAPLMGPSLPVSSAPDSVSKVLTTIFSKPTKPSPRQETFPATQGCAGPAPAP